MSPRPEYHPPPPTPPMSAATGDRVVIGLGMALAFIGLTTMFVERWTDMTMSSALGVPVFLSTPMGVGALLFIPLAWRVGQRFGIRQIVAACAFWGPWIFWSIQ